MVGRSIAFLFCCLITAYSGCGKRPNMDVNPMPAPNIHAESQDLQEAQVAAANAKTSTNKFAFDLYRDLAASETNVVFSPFSISLALAMTYAGAKDDTESALRKVFYFGDNTLDFHKSYGEFASTLTERDRQQNDSKLMLSNGLWLQSGYNVLAAFKNTLNDAYHSKLTELDFENDPKSATRIINTAVATETEGEISELLKQQLLKATRFVITNAIYFKSMWRSPFDADDTKRRNFNKADGTSLPTDFMMKTHHFPYAEDAQKQVLMMPYKDDDFAAVFILPREKQLSVVEDGLNDQAFDAILGGLSKKNVDMWLPKFSERLSPNLKDALIKRGLGVLFDKDRANLTGVAKRSPTEENLYVGNVIHEAVVKMYEKGTTAAAATAVVGLKATAIPSKPDGVVEFHADRPFLFFIIHKPSKTILFMGRLFTPNMP